MYPNTLTSKRWSFSLPPSSLSSPLSGIVQSDLFPKNVPSVGYWVTYLTVEKPGEHCPMQLANVNATNGKACWWYIAFEVIWREWHFLSPVFFMKEHDSCLIMKNKEEKYQLSDIVHNFCPPLLEIVKVNKKRTEKERWSNSTEAKACVLCS